jgi:hypothetical protein
MQRDCPSKRVLVVKHDGAYFSASNLMKIHLLYLLLTMQVMREHQKSILM